MRCANPLCKVESNYFRSGSLHSVDCGSGLDRRNERRMIWLCRECSPHWAVETWRPAGQQIRPRPSIRAERSPERSTSVEMAMAASA
jgi:ribosomal protein L37AE/L43A